MVVRSTPVFMALVMVAIVLGCSGGGGEPTVEEVYERMLEGMTSEGSILHSTMSFEVVEVDGTLTASGLREFWIDVPTLAYREEVTYLNNESFPDPIVYHYRDGDLYGVGEEGAVEVPTETSCAGSDSEILSEYLGCRELGTLQDDLVVQTNASYEGGDAILVGNDEIEGGFFWGLYVDRESYLPIARLLGKRGSDGGQTHLYTNEFVPRESLPPDFFEPGP